MYDCVFPTRTARFGHALVSKFTGDLNLKQKIYRTDFQPLEEGCECSTCKTVTRALVHRSVVSKQTRACHLLSVHNVHFQLTLMRRIRTAILENRFPDFVRKFVRDNHPNGDCPQWARNALKKVGVDIL